MDNDTSRGEEDDVTNAHAAELADLRRYIVTESLLEWARNLAGVSVLDEQSAVAS